MKVEHPDYEMCNMTLRKSSGKPLMEIDHFIIRGGKKSSRGKGLALRMVAKSVTASRKAGLDHIKLFAMGDKNDKEFNGYFVWNYYGWNGNIEEHRYKLDKAGFDDVEDTNSLFLRPGGKEFWAEHGNGIFASFDLKKGSRSDIILNQRLKEKGVRGL
jgi:hypothetical protein